MDHLRKLAGIAAVALLLGGAGCIGGFNYACDPTPDPDRPDPEAPDTILPSSSDDTIYRPPCIGDR